MQEYDTYLAQMYLQTVIEQTEVEQQMPGHTPGLLSPVLSDPLHLHINLFCTHGR